MLNYNYSWSVQTIGVWDYVLLPVYLTAILFFARRMQKKMIGLKILEQNYFISGLIIKIIGGLGVCFIYIYYYGWGDTVDYYYSSIDLGELLFKKSSVFFSILSGDNSLENLTQYYSDHGWGHIYRDSNSFAVTRITVFFSFLGLHCFLITSVLVATASYFGVWKLFRLFVTEFNEIKKPFAFAILFVPSVAFWGSGIMKDTYTLFATCLLFYCSYSMLLKKEKILKNIIGIIVSSYILISIRPYMFYISFDSMIIMLSYGYLSKIKTVFMKFLVFISIVILLWGGGISLFLYIGSHVNSDYSLDNLLKKAVITQEDLKRDEYGSNSFDIGKLQPTLPGLISKAPLAINAGLFYPYIWKARNPVMIIAGLENLVLLLLTLYVFLLMIIASFRNGIKYMFRTTFDHPIIIFSIVYSLQYAFMIGLTTANYGALVRYKIPLIPFYLATLFIIIYKFNRESAQIPDRNLNL